MVFDEDGKKLPEYIKKISNKQTEKMNHKKAEHLKGCL